MSKYYCFQTMVQKWVHIAQQSPEMSSEVEGSRMLTKLQGRHLKERLNWASGYRKKHTKNPDTICPMQQTHPSDEPDQGTKGTEGPNTRASVREICSAITTQGAQYSKYWDQLFKSATVGNESLHISDIHSKRPYMEKRLSILETNPSFVFQLNLHS